ncbi:hypothetical protein BEN71_06590 [Acinetobacter wuhouensis]|uniref:Uncharacterized protein n=1 Tax=Acinetobacter wuhouensis TaxID=1879050 RepID=A0A385C4D3_9GAMM|nr:MULTISPECIES: hypothetical protein [Acinetobacter]AXQ21752.1 hypothetical protein BEN71_06590 [Acinetobacter wuhouensis]AYO53830.1 hypothetical protein CDG68_09390 [Acinetobacter wuhouensis]RZG71710.1 hypothetical protein EXU29_12720 [Acinetobacter wuhouensis]RZG76327.1 hypothetical protein EXE09_08755 [Acinetobacter sp. WCHAc060025]RZG78660.1 hypothetical protein EXE10_17350 [Acinetobacter sp. WCHAc060033]
MPFFGFVPSEELLKNIQTGIEKKNSNEPLYPLRDQTALLINEEIIDTLLVELVRRFPESDKRDTAEKLAGYVKSTVAVLLKQLLSKADNNVVRASVEFSERSLFKDPQGQFRVGESLDANLITNLKNSFAEVASAGDTNRAVLSEQMKQFADATINHFMRDFNKTLDLGMIKRKGADIGAAAVGKAVHIAIDKLIPSLNKVEIKAVAEYYDTLFFN